MEYMVRKNEEQVGTVCVEEKGLYWEIRCRCDKLGNGFHRLYMVYQNKTIMLGVFVFEDGCYTVVKRIPKKTGGNGIPEFFAISDSESPMKEKIRLSGGEPVAKLETIRFWKLCSQDGAISTYFSEICGED